MDFRSNLFGKDENHEFLNACRLGQIEKVERFLKSNKIDINSQDEYGKTALICATDMGYKDILELLIKGGANLNIQDEYGKTALIYSAQTGYKDVVELLIKGGADLNIQEENSNTALEIAAKMEFKDIVELLIKGDGSFRS